MDKFNNHKFIHKLLQAPSYEYVRIQVHLLTSLSPAQDGDKEELNALAALPTVRTLIPQPDIGMFGFQVRSGCYIDKNRNVLQNLQPRFCDYPTCCPLTMYNYPCCVLFGEEKFSDFDISIVIM